MDLHSHADQQVLLHILKQFYGCIVSQTELMYQLKGKQKHNGIQEIKLSSRIPTGNLL